MATAGAVALMTIDSTPPCSAPGRTPSPTRTHVAPPSALRMTPAMLARSTSCGSPGATVGRPQGLDSDVRQAAVHVAPPSDVRYTAVVVEAKATPGAGAAATVPTPMVPVSASGAIPVVAAAKVTPPSTLRSSPASPSTARIVEGPVAAGTSVSPKTIDPARASVSTRVHEAPASAER